MTKIKFLSVCFLMLLITGCDIISNDKVIELPGLKNQSFECLNNSFNVDHINIVNDNSVEIYVTNISTSAKGPGAFELRTIKNGKPFEVRVKKELWGIDLNTKKTSKIDGSDVYPGESAVVKYTIDQSISSCDDYALYGEYCDLVYDDTFAKLSSLVDCSNLNKH